MKQFTRLNADPLTELSPRRRNNYNASADTVPQVIVGEGEKDHRSIFVDGFVLDKVNDVELEARGGEILDEWAKLANQKNHAQPLPDRFWRTLVANRGPNGENNPSCYSRACQSIFSKNADDAGINTTQIKDYDLALLAKFGERFHSTIYMRKLSQTRDREFFFSRV